MYKVSIINNSIIDDYFSVENESRYDFNVLRDKMPIEMTWGGDINYLNKHKAGIYYYTRKEIKELYYKKNGEEMPIKD